MFDSPRARFAIDAVRQASLLVRRVQQELVTGTLTKSDRSPVTVADFASQALVARLLMQAFPDDVLVGEEDAGDLAAPESRATLEQVVRFVATAVPGATAEDVCQWIDRGRSKPGSQFWTLDPVDGTKGFLRGEQYAIALALVSKGRVELGVLGCPNLPDPYHGGNGTLAVAQLGRGAWATSLGSHDFAPLRVSRRAQPTEARVLRSVESGHTNVDQMGDVLKALGTQAPAVLMDSQAKYVVLAAGSGDVLFRLLSADRPDYREKIWDQAAGALLLTEAGGVITDIDGKPLDFSQGRSLNANRGVLASNGRLHPAALAALRTCKA